MIASFAQTRHPAKRCDELCSSTATPRLDVKAGHPSNSASSCQMAWPAFWFYRAIHQSPGKTEDLPKVHSHPARTQTQTPGPLPPALCVVHGWSMNTRGVRGSSHTCCFEAGMTLESCNLLLLLPHKTGWRQMLSPPLQEDRGALHRKATARRLRPPTN